MGHCHQQADIFELDEDEDISHLGCRTNDLWCGLVILQLQLLQQAT